MHTVFDDEARGQAALYALGALDGQEADAFEEHLAGGCGECEAELKGYSAVLEGLAAAAPAAAPPEDARGQLLSRVAEEPKARQAGADVCTPAASAQAGQGFFILRAEEGEWLATEDEGISYKLLFADKERGTFTTLLRMRPGSRIPRHRHLGVEQCLVLEGDVRSGVHSMKAGDFNCSMPDSIHDELATDGGALLLLVSPASYEVVAH